MTLQALRYFVLLAEKGSFTEAAKACYVSQPAVSRAIAALEEELDCELLARGQHKRVSLTPAGDILLNEAKQLLKHAERLKVKVQQTAQTGMTSLTLGYLAYGMLNSFRRSMEKLLKQLQREGICLQPVYGAAPEIRSQLEEGKLDCAVLPDTIAASLPAFRQIPCCKLRRCLLVPREHPLFDQTEIAAEALRDQLWIFFDPQDLPESYADALRFCEQAGFQPRIVGTGRKAGDVVELLFRRNAVALVNEAFCYLQSDDLHVIPMKNQGELPGLTMVLAEKPLPELDRLWKQWRKNDNKNA